MRKQAGFTLIELVIVIIILGILAVTAAPKFLNLQDDAKTAAAQGVQAAVNSAAQLVYSKAALKGVETDATGTVSGANGTSVAVAYGYPDASDDGIGSVVNVDSSWAGAASGSTYVYSTTSSTCTVVYSPATSATSAASTTLSGDACTN
jgi:MSHA pilin protein MshA